MICGLEIGMLIAGILALARGSITFSKSKIVKGTPAYVIGLLLIAPLPVALGVGFIIGFQEAVNNPNANQPPPLKVDLNMALMEGGIVIGIGLFATALGMAFGKPASYWKRREYDEDDDEEEDDDLEDDDYDDDPPPRRTPPKARRDRSDDDLERRSRGDY